jgi:hypothetical protein
MAIILTNTNASSNLLTPRFAPDHGNALKDGKQYKMYERGLPPSLVDSSRTWRFGVRSAQSGLNRLAILSLSEDFNLNSFSSAARENRAARRRRPTSSPNRILTPEYRFEPDTGGLSWNCGC